MWKKSTLAILVGCAVDPDGGAAPNDPAPTPTAAEEQALSVAAETAGSEASCYRWSEVAAGEDVTVTWTAPVAYNSRGERCGLGGADLEFDMWYVLTGPAEHRDVIQQCAAYERVYDTALFYEPDPSLRQHFGDSTDTPTQFRIPGSVILPDAVTAFNLSGGGACGSLSIFLFPSESSDVTEVAL
jgi:hypothetical protein